MGDRFVAVVMAADAGTASGDAVVAALASAYPMLKPEDLTAKSKTPENGLVLKVGGAPITVRWVGAPLPADRLAAAAKTSIAWRGAAEAVARHQAHFIVAPLGEHDRSTATTYAALTSAAADAIAATTSSLGVYWAAADHLVEPGVFAKSAKAAARGAPALACWVKFMPVKGPDGPDGAPQTGFVTAGFKSFVGREIEFDPAPRPRSEIGAMLLRFMTHLLTSQTEMRDGAVVQAPPSDRLHVNLSDANRFTGQPVYRLRLETLAAVEPVAAIAESAAAAPDYPSAPIETPPTGAAVDASVALADTAADGVYAPEPEADFTPEAEPGFSPRPPEPAAPPPPEKSSGLFGRLFGKKK